MGTPWASKGRRVGHASVVDQTKLDYRCRRESTRVDSFSCLSPARESGLHAPALSVQKK